MNEGQKAHITFKNYSDKDKNWNNWLIVFTPVGAQRDVEGYSEYGVIRVDNWGWGNNVGNMTEPKALLEGVSITNDYNWDTFITDMDGSSVAMDVYNTDGKIYGSAVITTTAGKEYHYSFNTTDTGAKDFGFFLTVEKAHLTDLAVTVTDPTPSVTTVWSTTAIVSQFGVGGLTDAKRTLEYMSDGTFVVKEAFGEGTNDIILIVNEYGGVDFVGVTPDDKYYSYKSITGSDAITSIAAYGMGYNNCTYTLNNDGEYFKVPAKDGGELGTTYTAYAYKDQTCIGSGTFYVCWGKTRFVNTKTWPGVATLVGTPAVEGTVDGTWKESDAASIGFYYDEIQGDTVYRVNNWYGADKYIHFRTTDSGNLKLVSTTPYTGDATVNYLEAYDGSYSYTSGNTVYYVKNLVDVRYGEIGFFAYAYDKDANKINYYSGDWQKNYYIFRWENTDAAEPVAISTVKADNIQSAGKCIKNGRLVIMNNGREYNAAGQLVK